MAQIGQLARSFFDGRKEALLVVDTRTPSCKHGPAQLRFVSKEGPNKGRPFYSCPDKNSDKCLFQWADQKAQPSANENGKLLCISRFSKFQRASSLRLPLAGTSEVLNMAALDKLFGLAVADECTPDIDPAVLASALRSRGVFFHQGVELSLK